jgi:hypothetical protein
MGLGSEGLLPGLLGHDAADVDEIISFSGAGGTKCATSRGANGSVISNTRAPADLPSCRFALFKPSKPYFWRSTSRHCPEFDTADEDRWRRGSKILLTR